MAGLAAVERVTLKAKSPRRQGEFGAKTEKQAMIAFVS
jgi:hypothetical protein